MYDAVCIGGATKDIFLFLPTRSVNAIKYLYIEIPADRKIDIKDIKEYTGGSATNVAATLSKFGKNVMVVTRIGKDEYGKFIKNDLDKRGIKYRFYYTEETAFSVILVINNEMSILTYRKPESAWDLGKIRAKTRCVYVGPLPDNSMKVVKEGQDLAKRNDAIFAWNPGSSVIQDGLKNNLEYVKNTTIICMNDLEARKFVGRSSPLENAITLAKYAKIAIVTLGKKGSIVVANNKAYIAGVYPTKQINIVGAGDAFFSGFLNAILDKRGIEEAISLGAYNAASVVSKYGAKEGIVSEYPERLVDIKIRSI